MRAIQLTKVAAAAESLRLRRLARRQAIRAACAVTAGVFGIAALAVLHVAAWQGFERLLSPIWATMALLAADIIIMAILAAMAARNTPDPIEREALQIRAQALTELRTSLTVMALGAEIARLALRTGAAHGARRGMMDALAEIVTRAFRR